jgi:hypothetical protein
MCGIAARGGAIWFWTVPAEHGLPFHACFVLLEAVVCGHAMHHADASLLRTSMAYVLLERAQHVQLVDQPALAATTAAACCKACLVSSPTDQPNRARFHALAGMRVKACLTIVSVY